MRGNCSGVQRRSRRATGATHARQPAAPRSRPQLNWKSERKRAPAHLRGAPRCRDQRGVHPLDPGARQHKRHVGGDAHQRVHRLHRDRQALGEESDGHLGRRVTDTSRCPIGAAGRRQRGMQRGPGTPCCRPCAPATRAAPAGPAPAHLGLSDRAHFVGQAPEEHRDDDGAPELGGAVEQREGPVLDDCGGQGAGRLRRAGQATQGLGGEVQAGGRQQWNRETAQCSMAAGGGGGGGGDVVPAGKPVGCRRRRWPLCAAHRGTAADSRTHASRLHATPARSLGSPLSRPCSPWGSMAAVAAVKPFKCSEPCSGYSTAVKRM